MTDIILDKETSKKIVSSGTKASHKNIYGYQSTDKPFHTKRQEKGNTSVDYNDLIKIVLIVNTQGCTNTSRDRWKKDIDSGMYYYENASVVDPVRFKERFDGLDEDDKITVWSSIGVYDDYMDKFSKPSSKVPPSALKRVMALYSGYYFVIWMYERWNLFAPATWRNEEIIY